MSNIFGWRSVSRKKWKLFFTAFTLDLLTSINKRLTTLVDERTELNLIDDSFLHKKINQ